MAKNNVDQAPKIKSKGEKSPAYLKEGRSAWGSAIRPHELETIFANCLGAKAFSQYKIMMFLTGNAEEKFDVSLKNVELRCGMSKDTYYKARKLLIERGWLSIEEEGDKSYIIIHYDKIYKEGKDLLGLNIAEEGSSMIYTDESRLLDYSVEQSRLKDIPDREQSRSINIPVESKNEQGRSMICEEGRSMICEEGRLYTSQYNIENNKIENKIINATDSEQSRLKDIPVNEEEFRKEWGLLTGVAANF